MPCKRINERLGLIQAVPGGYLFKGLMVFGSGTTAVDFRADNMTNLDSLEENSLDIYAAFKSLYLQNREKKIENTFSSDDEDDWSEFNK
jgi:ABC-type transporter lipoprotein component MlaA